MTRLSDESAGLPEEGEHLALIESVEEYSKEGREPTSLCWTFMVGQPVPSYRVNAYTSIAPGKDWKTRVFLKGLGLPHKGPVEFSEDSLAGTWCRVLVVHEAYQGETRAKVSEIVGLADKPEDYRGPSSDEDAPPDDTPFEGC